MYHDPETGASYHESFEIDFEKYATFFSVNTSADDFRDDLKRQSDILKELVRAVEQLKEYKTDNKDDT